MFSISWLRDAVERAVRSAAQGALLAIGAAEGFNLFALDWLNLAGIAGGAAVLSVLTSIVGAPFGSRGSASFLTSAK